MLQRGISGEAGPIPDPAAPVAGGLLAGARWWRPDLGPDDWAALGLWAAAHLALFVLAWAAAWVYRATPGHAPLTGVFEHWDANILRNIAQYGYFSPHSTAHDTVFFPGYPMTLAAVHLILRSWVLAELVVSGIAGCFVVVSLSRLAGGRRAVLYLLTTPAAIFLMVGYTECLFLAFAIPAWHAAARGRWWRAALLAGLSGLVRPDAAFLIPALAVMALTGPRGARLANAGKACCALAGPAAYEIYLTVRLGQGPAGRLGPASGHPGPGTEDHLVGRIPAPVHRRRRVRVPAGARRDGRDAPGRARVPVVAPLARGRVLRAGRARARHADLVSGLPAHAPAAVPGLDRARRARRAPDLGPVRVPQRERAARRRSGAVVPVAAVGWLRPGPRRAAHHVNPAQPGDALR
jgi:hypothetical protein